MKHYSVNRVGLFDLLAEFPGAFKNLSVGPLFASAFIKEDTAQAILAKHPNALSLY